MAEDSENAVKILIQIIADTQGADAAQDALSKIKGMGEDGTGVTTKLSEATNELGGKQESLGHKVTEAMGGHRAMHQMFHLLGHETIPQFGRALGALRFGPIAAAVIAGGLAFEYFHKKIEEANKELDDFAERAADRGQTIKEAMEKAFVEVLTEEQASALKKRFDDIATGMERCNTAMQNAVALAKELRAIELEKTNAADAAINAQEENAVKEGRMTKEAAELNRVNRAAAEASAKTKKEEDDRAGDIAAKQAERAKAQEVLDKEKAERDALKSPNVIGDANKTIAGLPKSAQAAFAEAAATSPSGAGNLTTEIGRKATEAYLEGQNEVARKFIGEAGKDGKGGTGLTGDRDKAQAAYEKQIKDSEEQRKINAGQESRSLISEGNRKFLDEQENEKVAKAKEELDQANHAIQMQKDVILQNELRVASIKAAVDAEKAYTEKIDALTKKIGDLDQQIKGAKAIADAHSASGGDPAVQASRDAKTEAERRGIVEGFKPANAPTGSSTLIEELNQMVKNHQLTEKQAKQVVTNLTQHSENMVGEWNALQRRIVQLEARRSGSNTP